MSNSEVPREEISEQASPSEAEIEQLKAELQRLREDNIKLSQFVQKLLADLNEIQTALTAFENHVRRITSQYQSR